MTKVQDIKFEIEDSEITIEKAITIKVSNFIHYLFA